MKLRIHTWGEPVLRKKTRRVQVVDAKIRRLLDEMAVLMTIKDGIGLAANQAGLDLQMLVVAHKDKIIKLVNPCIIQKDGRIKSCEGCLSFPGIDLHIVRSSKVAISALDENGQQLNIEAKGVLAVVFQHEIDHLNGVLFIDRAPLLERLKVTPLLNKIRAESVKAKKMSLKTSETQLV